jgi:hypothetical protein
MAFNGYYMKIGNCNFTNPSPIKDGFKFAPKLVQVGDSKVLASGKLSTKVLPHDRSKIWVEFPPMTPQQFRTYWNALHSDSGGHGMYLRVQVYDDSTDSYITDTYYHTDFEYSPVNLGGQRMIKLESFELIGH